MPVVPLENPPNASPAAGLLLLLPDTGAPHMSCELKKSMLLCVVVVAIEALAGEVKLFDVAGDEKKSLDKPLL